MNVGSGKENHHWLVVNVPGNNVPLGHTITEFLPTGVENMDCKSYSIFYMYQNEVTYIYLI